MHKILNILFQLFTYRYYKYRYKVPNLKFNGYLIEIVGSGTLTCGNDCYVSYGTRIYLDESSCVSFGDNVAIGHNCRIYTSTVDVGEFLRSGERHPKASSVIIESNVIVGANVYIGPGVKIPANSIVKAGSVITKTPHSNGIIQ